MKADSEWPTHWVQVNPEKWRNVTTGYSVEAIENGWVSLDETGFSFTCEPNTLSLVDAMDMCDYEFQSRQT